MRGLGHEPVRAAHLFLEGHAPGAVDPHAEDGVDHGVAAAHLVGERLDHDALIVRHTVEHLAGLHEPGAQRGGRPRLEPAFTLRPVGEVRIVHAPGGVTAQAADGEAEVERARGMLALPERDRRRHAVRVFHQHAVGAHLLDLPRIGAEQEDVARQRLGDELLVERADLQIGLGHVDVVEPGVLDGAPGGQRQEARAAARVQPVVHAVPEHARRHPLDLVGQGLGHRAHDLAKRVVRKRPVRSGVDEALPQRVGLDRLGGHGRHDLLGEHVERRVEHGHAVQRPLVNRAHHRRRLHQLLALGHHDSALGHP